MRTAQKATHRPGAITRRRAKIMAYEWFMRTFLFCGYVFAGLLALVAINVILDLFGL